MNHKLSFLGLMLAIAPAAAETLSNDQDAENFLQTAEVVEMEPIGKGVTLSRVATLSNGSLTARAVWKTIDEYIPIKRFDDGGFPELGFRDSYKSEIAAYRLDRLIGLDLVPPTVARTIEDDDGALQLWIEDCITEGDRLRRKIRPPDVARFNQQMRRAKVFFQLIQDVDYMNMSNLLLDPDFNVYKIDSSRAFRTQKTILDPKAPDRYSRSLLEGLRRLDEQSLEEATETWLSERQRSSLLERRDLILERAERLIKKNGSKHVWDP